MWQVVRGCVQSVTICVIGRFQSNANECKQCAQVGMYREDMKVCMLLRTVVSDSRRACTTVLIRPDDCTCNKIALKKQ
jgi:hypothetical protein